MENISINYRELSFVLKFNCKQFFLNYFEKDKIKIDEEIEIEKLIGNFRTIKSNDKRYDGKDKFNFYLEQCKLSYRNFLNEKQFIKNKKFTAGKTIFYKILDEETLKFIEENVNYKHTYLYGKKK